MHVSQMSPHSARAVSGMPQGVQIDNAAHPKNMTGGSVWMQNAMAGPSQHSGQPPQTPQPSQSQQAQPVIHQHQLQPSHIPHSTPTPQPQVPPQILGQPQGPGPGAAPGQGPATQGPGQRVTQQMGHAQQMEQAEYGLGMSMDATMSRAANSNQGPVRWDADHA